MPRVTRSTFAAEPQGVIAEADNGITLSMTYETILSGTELRDQEFNLTDSWWLYLAGKPGNSKLPEDKSLLLELAARHPRSDGLVGTV
eukprot:1226619-Amphidinium_carterae.1